jgi:hypothetical protein
MAYDRGDYRDKWRIERLATAVRRKLGFDQIQPLSPWLLADAIPAHIFYPEDFDDDGLARRMRRVRWDGFAFSVLRNRRCSSCSTQRCPRLAKRRR